MFAYRPAEPLINSPFVKASFLLCCVLTLAACGGGGGSDTPANNNATNQPPTNVALTTVQASSSDVIDVAWSLAKDDKTIASTLTYQVHLSETAGFSPSSETLKFSQKGAVATQLTGLKPATAYRLKLVVIDDDGAQTVSAEKTVTTPNINVVNQSPMNVTLTTVQATSPTVVNASWGAASDDTTAASQLTYEVHMAEGGDFIPSASSLKFSGKNVLTTQVTGLKAATAYTVKLVAIDAQGLSSTSSGVSVTTQNIAAENKAPTNVALSTVQATSPTAVNVYWWTASDDTTAVSQLTYEVHMAEGGDFSPSASSLKFSGKDVLRTLVTGLKAATTYTVKLVAIDAQGLRSFSSGISVTTQNITTAPTNVALSTVQATSPTGVNASWGAASDDTTAASQLTYELHMAEGGDFTPSASSLKFSGKNVLTTQVMGLKAATAYTVKLVAIDAQGLRGTSSGRGITTLNVFSTVPQKLNDTGITKCDFFGTFDDCTAAIVDGSFRLNQDGEVGRDYLAAKGQLTKVGAGIAGFDFTKISAAGEKLPATATAWSCVLDNQTGLMWEMKTNDGGLQDATKTYQWYNTDTSTNGGTVGYANGGNNTQAFTQAINSKALCGHTDWRLPEKQELHSIVNYGKVDPAIDSAYFPNTVSSYYWSSSPVAYNNIDRAWMVDFYAGNDLDYFGNFGNGKGGKADNLYVRLVRSDQ